MFKSQSTDDNNLKSVPVLDAYRVVHLRAIAQRLVKWIFANHSFRLEDDTDSNSQMSEDGNRDNDGGMSGDMALVAIYQPFLVQQAHALVQYMRSAEAKRQREDIKADTFADMHIKSEEFKSAMDLHFEEGDLKEMYNKYEMPVSGTLSWVGGKFTIHRLSEYTKVDLSINGLTPTDTAYGLDPQSFPSFHEKRTLNDGDGAGQSPRKCQKTGKSRQM
ncbi:hypothetical protein DXG01_009008 [Tephrocybe rancida]|nr:hypothetical protein DXG01_009008 [Tephrocybe rancida]